MAEQKKPYVPRYDVLTPLDNIQFNPAEFDELMRSNGVELLHYRAIKCPLGVDDKFDVRSHADHTNCSNGYLYKLAGEITGFFSGNSSNFSLEDLGMMDGSTVQVTLPRFYDGSDVEVAVQHHDRFFLKEVVASSVNTQLIESHIAGTDRLQYPAVYVEHVMDAHGKEYGTDAFIIKNGQIVWSASDRPPYDAKLGRGTVYSIRYRYVPFWYVNRLVHEVRVCRVYDYQKDKQVVVRMPHAISLQREYVFENEQAVKNNPSPGGGTPDARDVRRPRSGSFGPR